MTALLRIPDGELPERGEFCWEDGAGETFILFGTPVGGGLVRLPVVVGPAAGRAWGWNGDRDRPTLTPSIAIRNAHAWHGYLTNGELREI